MEQNLQAALYGEGREIHQCALPGNVGHLSIPFNRIPYTDLKHIEQQGRVRFWPLVLPLGPKVHMQWGNVNDEMKVMKFDDFTSSFHSVMVWCDGMILKVGFWGHLQSKGFRAKSIEFAKIQIGLPAIRWSWMNFEFDIMIHVMIWSDRIISYHIISFGQWFDSQGLDLPKSISLQSIGHCIGVPSPAMFEKLQPRQLWRFL